MMLHSQGLLKRACLAKVEQLHRILQLSLASYVWYMQMLVQVVPATVVRYAAHRRRPFRILVLRSSLESTHRPRLTASIDIFNTIPSCHSQLVFPSHQLKHPATKPTPFPTSPPLVLLRPRGSQSTVHARSQQYYSIAMPIRRARSLVRATPTAEIPSFTVQHDMIPHSYKIGNMFTTQMQTIIRRQQVDFPNLRLQILLELRH